MYRACLHCAAALGANEAIEAFPIGRSLAFDEARGRLWVICPSCRRWNLVPMDRRWEAIEGCARAFADTPRRYGTGEIALARLADGTSLVRVGAPLLPEYAAWRYGDQVAERRRKSIARGLAFGALAAGGVAVAVPALATAGSIAGFVGGIGFSLFQGLVITGALRASGGASGLALKPVAIQDEAGLWVVPAKNTGYRFVADPSKPEGWGLRLNAFGFMPSPPSYLDQAFRNTGLMTGPAITIGGERGLTALRRLLPRVNAAGAPGRRIATAVDVIEEAGAPADFLPHLARNLRPYITRQVFGDSGEITALPAEIRLAMEMAVHDELEREALEGELARLEDAWREAEAIAAIADRLLTPAPVQAKLDALRAGRPTD
jgi:hypothetical protein